MADESNLPPGAVPPKKETGKVQPKKETVRISLPPKPTSAPTIKLPTLPAGGAPPGSAAPGARPAIRTPSSAAKPPGAPAATGTVPGRPAAPPSAAPAPGARPGPSSVPAPRSRASVGGGAALGKLDVGLAIAATVLAIGAIVSVLFLLPIK